MDAPTSGEAISRKALLSALCHETDCILWRMYRGEASPETGGLVFPRYRDNKRRVSEQETRFAFAEALWRRGGFRYSVETPTEKRYSFSGRGSRSAMTDLSIYDGGERPICNVEFKFGGVGDAASGYPKIRKDLEKLFREPVWGHWFHVLESVDNGTINKLMSVLTDQIYKVRKCESDIDACGLTIHICVLKHRFSLHKDLPKDFSPTELSVNLGVTGNILKTIHDLNGWCLHESAEQ